MTGAALLALTLGCWWAARHCQRLAGGRPFAHPVVGAAALAAAILALTGVEYSAYFAANRPLHWLLGPATVALAVPLHRQLKALLRAPGRVLAAVAAGSFLGTATALLLAGDAPPAVLASLAPRGVTTPVAMAVTDALGGLPSLSAALVIASGLVGAAAGPALLDRLGIHDPFARGLALGTASHAIGTARALEESPAAGAAAALAMGIAALLTALSLPPLWSLAEALAR